MMTIKLVEHNGHEQIFQVDEVWADRNPAKDAGEHNGGAAFAVHATKPGLPEHPLIFSDFGNVYVMNDAGKTIAKYYLGG